MKRVYEICEKKVYIHTEHMKKGLFELSACGDGDYYAHKRGSELGDTWNWMSSFVTGLAPLLFQVNHDTALLRWANMFKDEYSHKIFKTPHKTMHDIGFLYMPYSVHMWKITGDSEHRDTALRAADELAKRFNLKGRYIEAWSDLTMQNEEESMIADTMMNIPLLLWAWKETGHRYYYDVASGHIDTVKKLLVRSDFSVCHGYRFNAKTGAPKGEFNNCGYDVGSYWARGAAWIIYGFAIAAEYTGNDEYLDIAVNLSLKFVECLTEDDIIPVWDFRLPKDMPSKVCGKFFTEPWNEADEKNKKFNRDTSAAAIAACGFLSINTLRKNEKLMKTTDKIMESLCGKYLNTDTTIPGILSCSNGNMSYTMFGDYFFVEALVKYTSNAEDCWG